MMYLNKTITTKLEFRNPLNKELLIYLNSTHSFLSISDNFFLNNFTDGDVKDNLLHILRERFSNANNDDLAFGISCHLKMLNEKD